ncbi:MAG: endonuclease/exonuclease/phosphatase family protein [Bacteroidota bacterium]
MNKAFILIFLCTCTAVVAQVPKYGNDTLLDVACWNVEWLGNTSNGPTNEALQYSNVKTIINNADVDMWGLCEVSDNTTWMNLLNDLPDYDGAIATYSQTQKTALLFKKNMFTMQSWQMVLTESQYNYDFADRPPLEVVLTTKGNNKTDTLYVYVIHLKAFDDQESYTRRKNAAAYLKTFLDANRKNDKVMVIGDWNDDVNQSIWSGATQSPFVNFVTDSPNYFFISKRLSDLGKASYAFSGGSMIDHILINNSNNPYYVANSSRVLDSLPFYISGYVNNTSDHYPVMGYFNYKRYTVLPVSVNDTYQDHVGVSLYPNPASSYITLESNAGFSKAEFYSMNGLLELILTENFQLADVTELPAGLHYIRLTTVSGETVTKKLLIQR